MNNIKIMYSKNRKKKVEKERVLREMCFILLSYRKFCFVEVDSCKMNYCVKIG